MANLLTKHFLFLSIILSSGLTAKNFGTHGHLFPIEEEDLLEHLQSGMTNEPSLISDRDRLITKMENPDPVLCNLNCSQERSYYFDPSVEVKREITDSSGKVIVAKGTRVNPLDSVSLHEDLLFFDSRNPDHLEWARKHKGKWILVAGSAIDLEKEEGRPVYFDQRGTLIKKFGVEAVPAKVSQSGKQLRIQEIPLCTYFHGDHDDHRDRNDHLNQGDHHA